jgi:hypothetical protein
MVLAPAAPARTASESTAANFFIDNPLDGTVCFDVAGRRDVRRGAHEPGCGSQAQQ